MTFMRTIYSRLNKAAITCDSAGVEVGSMIVKTYTILTLALLAFSGHVRAAEKLQMYEDFFHIYSRGKQVRYIAVARFWSDIDREYLSRATRDAIAEGLTEGLTRVEGEVDLAVIGVELEAAFLDRFITTLALYKIVNKRLQVDLYFLPVPDSPVDYAPQRYGIHPLLPPLPPIPPFPHCIYGKSIQLTA